MEQSVINPPYYTLARSLLEGAPVIRQGGFVVEVWGSGPDHKDLLQVKKPIWRVMTPDGAAIGYKGIEVHYESCRPGHFVLHCELFPRLGKKEKAQVMGATALLELKGRITRQIRKLGCDSGWERIHGAHLKRIRGDPADPSSLIVYTFDLGLPEGHSPEQFVSKALPIIEATASTIEGVLIEAPRK